MTGFQLLFGTTWRGGAAGAILGAVYFIVHASLMILAETSGYGGSSCMLDILFFVGLVGMTSIYGALFGALIGFIFGFLSGILIGIFTRLFDYPLKHALVYRGVIALTSGVYIASTTEFILLAFIWYYYNNVLNILISHPAVVIPGLIAGIAAAIFSWWIARWYEHREVEHAAPINVETAKVGERPSQL